jgi:hypothetical protein
MHAESTEAQYDLANQHHQEIRSIVRENNDLLRNEAGLVLTISRLVANFTPQKMTQGLQNIMLKLSGTNMKIYQIVLDIQSAIQHQLPAQINRQEPVYFEDAHGRVAPFHIEFVDSLEAFEAVMEVRFRHVPGLKKFQRKEYILQEPRSKRKLNLQAPWPTVFLPGRKVVMSMIFQTPQISMSSCPGCQTEKAASFDDPQSEVQW